MTTKDGWTAEISIPFALMRYPKGTKSFGVLLFRRLARETTFECWPYVPPGGDIQEAQYMSDFIGINPTPIGAAGESGGPSTRSVRYVA